MLSKRAAPFLIGLAGLVLFGWLSVQVYRSRIDPEGFRAWNGPYAWIVGPPPDALSEAAERRVQRALERLNDRSLPPAERLRSYREELNRAEELLIRSLRAQPAQARALAQLAAVRWELDPPLTEEAARAHLEMIDLASSMAPTVPGIQVQLGELLLKMGRRDEAVEYLARTVELNPQFTPRVVGVMRDNLFTADRILESLPPGAGLLVALRQPFIEDGEETALPGRRRGAALRRPGPLHGGVAAVVRNHLPAPGAAGAAARDDGADRSAGVGGRRGRALAPDGPLLPGAGRIGARHRGGARARPRTVPGFRASRPRTWATSPSGAGDPGLAIEAYREALALAARASASPARPRRLLHQARQGRGTARPAGPGLRPLQARAAPGSRAGACEAADRGDGGGGGALGGAERGAALRSAETMRCAAGPSHSSGARFGFSRPGQHPIHRLDDALPIRPDDPVRALADRDGTLRVLPQRQTRHAQDRRLFLNAAGVGQHEARLRHQPQELEVAQRLEQTEAGQSRTRRSSPDSRSATQRPRVRGEENRQPGRRISPRAVHDVRSSTAGRRRWTAVQRDHGVVPAGQSESRRHPAGTGPARGGAAACRSSRCRRRRPAVGDPLPPQVVAWRSARWRTGSRATASVSTRLISSGMSRSKLRRPASTCARGMRRLGRRPAHGQGRVDVAHDDDQVGAQAPRGAARGRP